MSPSLLSALLWFLRTAIAGFWFVLSIDWPSTSRFLWVTWLAATGMRLPVSVCDLTPPRLFAWSPPRAPGVKGKVLFCDVSYFTLIQIIRPRGRSASSHTAGRRSPRLAETLFKLLYERFSTTNCQVGRPRHPKRCLLATFCGIPPRWRLSDVLSGKEAATTQSKETLAAKASCWLALPCSKKSSYRLS